MALLYRDRKVKGIADLLRSIKKTDGKHDCLWLRGHASVDWSLIPSVGRKAETATAEMVFLKRFKQNAFRLLEHPPQTEWEWLFLMQHYRVPTRLLDWTESPLVALYFAVSDADHAAADAALWCLLPTELNKKTGITFKHPKEIPFFDEEQDNPLRGYLPSVIAREQSSSLKPAAGIAVRNSPRISAQLGVFTITHREQVSLEAIDDGKHLWRFIIPAAAKKDILRELAYLKVSNFTVFPELDRVSSAVTEGLQ